MFVNEECVFERFALIDLKSLEEIIFKIYLLRYDFNGFNLIYLKILCTGLFLSDNKIM